MEIYYDGTVNKVEVVSAFTIHPYLKKQSSCKHLLKIILQRKTDNTFNFFVVHVTSMLSYMKNH